MNDYRNTTHSAYEKILESAKLHQLLEDPEWWEYQKGCLRFADDVLEILRDIENITLEENQND